MYLYSRIYKKTHKQTKTIKPKSLKRMEQKISRQWCKRLDLDTFITEANRQNVHHKSDKTRTKLLWEWACFIVVVSKNRPAFGRSAHRKTCAQNKKKSNQFHIYAQQWSTALRLLIEKPNSHTKTAVKCRRIMRTIINYMLGPTRWSNGIL